MELLLIYQEKIHLIQFGYFSKTKCLNLQENNSVIILSNIAVRFLVTKMISNDWDWNGKSQRTLRIGNFIQDCFYYLYSLRILE